jgi:hypothetical protein
MLLPFSLQNIQAGTINAGNWHIFKPATITADTTTTSSPALQINNNTGTVITSNAFSLACSTITSGAKAGNTINAVTTMPLPFLFKLMFLKKIQSPLKTLISSCYY